MATLKETKRLKILAEELQLENWELIKKYKLVELASICNGIGPEAFPDWLRDFISAIHPSLAVVAFVHDIEWHESDHSKEKFTESNNRFKRNGYLVAKKEYGWYNPRRYLVMNDARRYGNLCQLFGWDAWLAPCQCIICRKKNPMKENIAKENEK